MDRLPFLIVWVVFVLVIAMSADKLIRPRSARLATPLATLLAVGMYLLGWLVYRTWVIR